jgi:hypothetical protein
MNRKALVTIIAGAGASVLVLAGCNSGGNASGAQQESNDSASIEKSFLLNQPPPHFQHSDIRATAISIEAIQALGEQTTTFFFNQGVKDPIMTCPSLGEPVASTTEITNPQQTTSVNVAGGPNTGATIGNMDPNGIYAGDSTGTYVLCVNAQGQQYASYWEGFVESVSGPATWDTASGTIKVAGAPSMPTCTVAQPATKKAATTCVK